jgi:hypothetical protein
MLINALIYTNFLDRIIKPQAFRIAASTMNANVIRILFLRCRDLYLNITLIWLDPTFGTLD